MTYHVFVRCFEFFQDLFEVRLDHVGCVRGVVIGPQEQIWSSFDFVDLEEPRLCGPLVYPRYAFSTAI